MIQARFCQFTEPLSFEEAVSLQEHLVQKRIRDEIPDTCLLLQHTPVITLGRRGRKEHLRVDSSKLSEAGIDFHIASRGGDVTVHGPGQWVLYPILKLSKNEMGAHGYLHALESISIQTAEAHGIHAYRRDGMAGAWCDQGKFSAVGFKFTKWVSMHGLSLNVSNDPGLFDLIVGCGLEGEPVTSFKQILGHACPELDEVASTIRAQAGQSLQREFQDISPKHLM